MPSVNSNKTAGCKEQKEKTNDGSAFRLEEGDMGDKTFNEHQGYVCRKNYGIGPNNSQNDPKHCPKTPLHHKKGKRRASI